MSFGDPALRVPDPPMEPRWVTHVPDCGQCQEAEGKEECDDGVVRCWLCLDEYDKEDEDDDKD